MKNSKMIAAILMAMILSTSVLAGCSTTDSNSSLPESSESSSSEASVPEESETTITGVVKETSDTEMVVTLEDGSELTLNVEGLENLGDVAIGDSITINYAQEGDVLVASSLEKVESEESSSSASEQSADQQAESNASQSSAPATNSPAATSNSGTTAATANTNKSAKERAQALFATGKLEVLDWNTPAVAFSGAMDRMTLQDEDRNIIAFFYPANVNNMESDLKANGFYDSQDISNGWVKAFNDYRGLETDLVNNLVLDDSMTNYICYRYDANTDSFSKVLIPVNGSGSTGGNSNSGSSNSSSTQDKPSAESGDVYEAIELINAERAKAGLNELEIDSDLMEMASVRAEEMSREFAHTRPDGSDWKTIFEDFGWSIPNHRGENGGGGKDTAEKQVNSWMNSSGHKANILKEDVTKIGVGYHYNANSQYGDYWTMIVAE